jgi:hypothetical protein
MPEIRWTEEIIGNQIWLFSSDGKVKGSGSQAED